MCDWISNVVNSDKLQERDDIIALPDRCDVMSNTAKYCPNIKADV